MDSYNNNLVKTIDPNRVGRTQVMNDYYKKHPEEKRLDNRSIIPGQDTNQAEKAAYDLMKIIEASLQRKKHAGKKTKAMNAKMVAAVVIGGVVFISSAVPLIKKGIDSHGREVELNNAIAYMDENILPDVYANSGFVISGMGKFGEPIYEFNRINGINAVDYLMENYNIDRPTAEFIVAKSLNYDQRLYPEGQTPEGYYASQGYITGDSLDQYSVFNSPIKTFENMNEINAISAVDRIKEEGRTNGTRS